MAGNYKGGVKAGKSNKQRHGKDFYKRIGSMGGKAPRKGKRGFALMDREKRREAGRKGGAISKRGKAKRKAWQEYEDMPDQRPVNNEVLIDD